MHNNKSIIFILLLSFAHFSFGEITSTFSIESSTIKDLSTKIDAETIILINIDDTLIMSESKMFLPTNPHHSFIDILTNASKARPFFNKAIQNWLLQRKLVLVEPSWPEFVEELQKKGAQVWGMSQMHYKIYALIQNPEEWRYNELIDLKVLFSEKLAGQSIVKLSIDSQKQPIFYKGIIFTGKANKAETILDLLKTGNLRPKKIIIIDNNKTDLKLMQRALRKFDIDFYGINYLAVSQMKIKINEELIKLQQDTLIHEGKWLEDDQALEMLKSKNSSS
jgi:hypothetical protein